MRKVCSICGNKYWAKGYCAKHYRASSEFKAVKLKYRSSEKGKLKEKEYYAKTKLHQFELKKKYRLLPKVQEKERLRAKNYYWLHQKERLDYAKRYAIIPKHKENKRFYRKLSYVRIKENKYCKKYKKEIYFKNDLT